MRFTVRHDIDIKTSETSGVTNDREYPPGLTLSADQHQKWIQVAYAARTCELVLQRIAGPKPESLFSVIDEVYGDEKISTWTRSYLLAAAEHLSLWSDSVAPYVVAPGMRSPIRLRAYLSLARASLESASHALWLLGAPQSVSEWVERFVQLISADFRLHRKALIDGQMDTTHIDERLAVLSARLEELSLPMPPRAPGYLKLVRHAAIVTQNYENRWAYLWNAAAGAAHGQKWLSAEASIVLGTAGSPRGHHMKVLAPDPSVVSEAMEAAGSALQAGTCRWLPAGKHDLDLLAESARGIHDRMPKKNTECGS